MLLMVFQKPQHVEQNISAVESYTAGANVDVYNSLLQLFKLCGT
jgi:hypothetical protein